MRDIIFYLIFLCFIGSNLSYAEHPCSAREHYPKLTEYYTEIIVQCGSNIKHFLGSTPLWRDDNTLIFKKFISGNLAVPAELQLPEMTMRNLSQQAYDISHLELSADKRQLLYSVSIPTLNPADTKSQVHFLDLTSNAETLGPNPETEIDVIDDTIKSESGSTMSISAYNAAVRRVWLQ